MRSGSGTGSPSQPGKDVETGWISTAKPLGAPIDNSAGRGDFLQDLTHGGVYLHD